MAYLGFNYISRKPHSFITFVFNFYLYLKWSKYIKKKLQKAYFLLGEDNCFDPWLLCTNYKNRFILYINLF